MSGMNDYLCELKAIEELIELYLRNPRLSRKPNLEHEQWRILYGLVVDKLSQCRLDMEELLPFIATETPYAKFEASGQSSYHPF